MNIEEEHQRPIRIQKVGKTTRPAKGVDLTDRIVIKKPNRTKAGLAKKQIIQEELHHTYPVMKNIQPHKKRVSTFITTVCLAAIMAFIASELYLTARALHQANLKIDELTHIINNSATTIVSEELDPKQKILQEIGKRMELPTGEEPTMVVIEDAERASREQVFYSQVIAGDMVVIYPNAKKAIIWSPSRMKIINAGVVDIQQTLSEEVKNASTTIK
jgi:hypothetical protein